MTSEIISHGGEDVISGDAHRQHIENHQIKKDRDWEKRVIEKETAEAFLKL